MVNVISVRVYPKTIETNPGLWYYGAVAEVCPACATCTGVVWHSSDTSVATVNESNGYIYAKSAGTAKIYATAVDGSGKNDYLTITVRNSPIMVESISLNKTSISLEIGDEYTLSTTICPENAANKSVIWSSSNTNIASVDNGVVTARAVGSAVIQATAADGSGKSSCCTVSVPEDVLVSSITLNYSSYTLNANGSVLLSETVCPTNATNKRVTWSSDKPHIAFVNSDSGLVTAQSAGEAVIRATAADGSDKYVECTVTVNPPIFVTDITLYSTSLTMNVGDIEYLCASITPYNATNKTVIWCSSNENVATVGLYTGRISANMAGVTTITATTADGGFTACCTVTISQVLTGADLYIDDAETRNIIIQYKNMYDYIQSSYLNGTLNICQKKEQQSAIEKAINTARADYVILNSQSDFVYQYFKGRNYKIDDISPFIRESYTYPNDGYNDPKDTLAIMIIQRTLELLTYFEPPNEYEYGTYDQETHNALLSSPFYILGSNDFQKYSYYDMLGSTTLNERTKSNVKLLHKMRLFHNEVAKWVASKIDGRTQNTTIYKTPDHSKWGFADVMKTAVSNEYIWEVKPWDKRYRVLNGLAAGQLQGYIEAWNNSKIEQKYSPRLPALPGYNIGKFAFKSKLTNQTIVVESNPAVAPDFRSGLVHYYPTKDDNEYQAKYAAEYVLETQAMPVVVPTNEYSFGNTISFGNIQVTGMAEVLGQIVVVAVFAATLYYISPYLLLALI